MFIAPALSAWLGLLLLRGLFGGGFGGGGGALFLDGGLGGGEAGYGDAVGRTAYFYFVKPQKGQMVACRVWFSAAFVFGPTGVCHV